MKLRRGSPPKFFGLAIKSTDPAGIAVLKWINPKDVGKVFDPLFDLILKTAQKYAIPEAEYGKYNFLHLNTVVFGGNPQGDILSKRPPV